MQMAHNLPAPGEFLRRTRMRLGLTTRQVAELSKTIAAQRGREEFSVSHACLVQIENGGSVPGLFKLYSLSAIYGISATELFTRYVGAARADRLYMSFAHANTHLLSLAELPDNGNHPTVAWNGSQETSLLSQVDAERADIGLLELDAAPGYKYKYGQIGTSDYRMYPLIRPGSLVQLEECRKPAPAPRVEFRTEFDRPIYFVETRTSYLCCWCEFERGRLIAIPHPLSPYRIEQYLYPSEAELVGVLTGLVIRLAPGEQIARQAGKSRTPVQTARESTVYLL